MINCPLKGFPRVSQWYGERPEVYKKIGLKSHNGIDFAVPSGTDTHAPFDGEVFTGFDKDGYGKYVKIISREVNDAGDKRYCVLAHLSDYAEVKEGQWVKAGDLVGHSGDTGFSSGPHLHMTYKIIGGDGQIKNYNNGNYGAIDIWGQKWDGMSWGWEALKRPKK